MAKKMRMQTIAETFLSLWGTDKCQLAAENIKRGMLNNRALAKSIRKTDAVALVGTLALIVGDFGKLPAPNDGLLAFGGAIAIGLASIKAIPNIFDAAKLGQRKNRLPKSFRL